MVAEYMKITELLGEPDSWAVQLGSADELGTYSFARLKDLAR